jgi:hypothetical protein
VRAERSDDIRSTPIAALASRPGAKSRTRMPEGTLSSSRRMVLSIRRCIGFVLRCWNTAPAIGATTHTSSTLSKGSTSMFVTECMPPSTCHSPPIRCGANKPGTAHDAATAVDNDTPD